MQLWKGTSEQFVKKMGWIKKKGWRIDPDQVSDVDHFDYIYFEDLSYKIDLINAKPPVKPE